MRCFLLMLKISTPGSKITKSNIFLSVFFFFHNNIIYFIGTYYCFAEMEGVFESKQTTHSWDFIGLGEEETMEIPGFSTKEQVDVIIGFIDTGGISDFESVDCGFKIKSSLLFIL